MAVGVAALRVPDNKVVSDVLAAVVPLVTLDVAVVAVAAVARISSPAVMVTGIYAHPKKSPVASRLLNVEVGLPSSLPPRLVVVHTTGTVELISQCCE